MMISTVDMDCEILSVNLEGAFEIDSLYYVSMNLLSLSLKDRYNDDKINYSSFVFGPLVFYWLGFMGIANESDKEEQKKLLYGYTFFNSKIHKLLITGDNTKLSVFLKNSTDWFFIREHKWWHFSPGLGLNYEYKDLQLQVGYNYNIDYALGDWHTDQGMFFSVGWGVGGDSDEAAEQERDKKINFRR